MALMMALLITSNTGSSVIDYITGSNDLFSVEFVSSFEIAPRVESSHLPLSIYARANQSLCDDVNKTEIFSGLKGLFGTVIICMSFRHL